MSPAQRLLELIRLLRQSRFPVTGAVLAAQLGTSLRTLYRDISALQRQGAHIDGEPGLGFILRPGFMLPPLMFSDVEIEALMQGSRWVAKRGDKQLGAAARNALAKIAAVLPDDLRNTLDTSALPPGPEEAAPADACELPLIRQAIRSERKLDITYRDLKNATSTRTVWPCALSFRDHVRVLVAWCEQRQTFRHFRADRITALEMSPQRYPRRRQVLLKEWRAVEGMPAQ